MTADTQKAFDMFLKIDSKSFANYVRPINYAQGVNNNSSFVAVELLYLINLSFHYLIARHNQNPRCDLKEKFTKVCPRDVCV